MKKRKMWRFTLPLAGVTLISSSAVVGQVVANSNVLNHNRIDDINNKLIELTNNEIVSENNESDNPNISNVSPRVRDEIPSFHNNINWNDYNFVDNGIYAGSNRKNNILPENGLFAMFPDIVKTDSSGKKSVNLLDFLFLNDNYDSACSKRYDQIFDWYNFQMLPGMKRDSGGVFPDWSVHINYGSSHLQGVKFKSFKYDSSKKKFQVTTALACQFYNWKTFEISTTRLQTDIVIELDPPFWLEPNWDWSKTELQKLFQAKIDQNNGILPKVTEILEITSSFCTQKIQRKYVNINKISSDFFEAKCAWGYVGCTFEIVPSWKKEWHMIGDEYKKFHEVLNGGMLYGVSINDHPVNIKKSNVLDSVDAQTIGEFVPQFKNLSANEVLELWKQNRKDKLFTDFISEVNKNFFCIGNWDNDGYEIYDDVLSRHIFINAPIYDAQKITIKNIESITGPNSYNSLKFTFNLTSAQGDPGQNHVIPNLKLSTIVTNFKIDIVTNLIKTTIDATDPEFKNIFGSNNKGFTIDFDNNKTTNQTSLMSYINNHISTFFGDTHGYSISVNNVVINVNSSSNSATATITYSGHNGNMNIPTNTATINIINLKPNPTPSTFADFKQFLQNKVDTENKGATPTNDQIKQWVAAYLTQPDITAKLPDAVGTISSNNVTLDASKIDKSKNPIKFNEGAIKTNTNPVITIPSINLKVKCSKACYALNATAPINQYKQSEVLAVWKVDKTNKMFDNFKAWMTQFLNIIFYNDEGLPEGAEIVSIDNFEKAQTSTNDKTSLRITITVSKAYTIDQGIASNRQFSFIITNFKEGNVAETNQKITEINYQDQLFKDIFGTNNKGFAVDFDNEIASNKTKLQNYMTSHVNQFLNTNGLASVEITRVSQLDKSSNNISHVTFVYNGYDSQGNYFTNKNGTINIVLRPTPGTDTSPEAINPLAGIEKFLQNKVNSNNNLFPNINTLKQWVAEYLNQANIKDNLPNSLIPSSGNFSSNDITIDSSKIIHQTSPITIQAGAISTTINNNKMEFPQASINVKQTTANNIAATSPINNYYTSEISSKWQNNKKDDPKIVAIKNWINNKKSTIFTNLPPNATITLTDIKSVANETNALNIKVSVSEAYDPSGDNYNTVNNKEISFKITGFNSTSVTATKLTKTEISYKDSDFKSIFVNCKNGYTVDFNNDISNEQTQLKDYINNNISTFFNNTSGIDINVSNVKITVNTNTNTANATVTFSGFNSNGIYVENNTGNITIKLKPTPGTDSSTSEEDSPFTNFESVLQDRVNANDGIFPTEATLKEWVAEYLNKPEVKDNLPSSAIPSSGSFSSSDITINMNKIIHQTSPITVQAGAISTNVNNIQMQLPQASITVKQTTVNDVAATNPINDYYTSEILSKWNTNPQDQKITTIKNWVETNKTKIFTNLPSGATITLNKIEPVASETTSLKITVTLSKAYDPSTSDCQPAAKEVSFKITGFNSAPTNATTLKKTTINYTDPEFKEIFTNCTNGYTVDFNKDIDNEQTQLKNYINSHINVFFENASGSVTVSNIKITVDESANTATATVTYSGFDSSGGFKPDNIGVIAISLRSTPGTNPDETNDPLKNWGNFLQDKINSNNGVFPDLEKLKEWVSEYLNQPDVKNNLPSSCIPGGANGSFSPSDITIDDSMIDHESNPIVVQQGAISTNTSGSNIQNGMQFSETSVNVKVTSTNDVVASGSIKDFFASEILAKWNSNQNDPKITAIKTWINDNKASIFNDLPPNAEITLNNIQADTNTSLNITVVVTKAYDPSGDNYQTVDNKSLSFKITNFKQTPTNATTLKKTTINYTDPEFKEIFTNCQNGYTIDFNKDVVDVETQLMNYMNNHIETFFNNVDGIDVQVSNVSISVEVSDNTATATITYNGFDSSGEYLNNITGNISIILRPTPGTDVTDPSNPLADFNTILQDRVNQNNGIFPDEQTLKEWISEYLNTKKDQLPNTTIPASGKFSPNDIRVDTNAIHKGDTIVIDNGAISTNGTNTTLSLPGANINIKITTINSLIDVSNSSISNITIEQLLNDQKDPNSPTMQKVNEYLNVHKNKENIFKNLPEDATVNVVINSISLNPDNTLSLSINATQAYTPNGLETNVVFKAQMQGFDNIQKPDTILKITEIKYDQELFKDIWANDKGYAIDWAYLKLNEIEDRETQLLEYINVHVQEFFDFPINTDNNVVTKVKFNFTETKNKINIEITFSGIKGNVETNDLTGNINLLLRSTDGEDNYIDEIFGPNGPIQNEIQNWVDNNPGKAPTKEDLANIINGALNKPINPNNPESPIFGDLLPNIYPHEITPEDIDQEKIHINGNHVTIDAGAIQIKPQLPTGEDGQPITPQGNWGPVNNIVLPELNFSPSNLKIDTDDNKLWIWAIIGSSIAIILILIILIIVFVSKSRKK